jgi:hypothetical protein
MVKNHEWQGKNVGRRDDFLVQTAALPPATWGTSRSSLTRTWPRSCGRSRRRSWGCKNVVPKKCHFLGVINDILLGPIYYMNSLKKKTLSSENCPFCLKKCSFYLRNSIFTEDMLILIIDCSFCLKKCSFLWRIAHFVSRNAQLSEEIAPFGNVKSNFYQLLLKIKFFYCRCECINSEEELLFT